MARFVVLLLLLIGCCSEASAGSIRNLPPLTAQVVDASTGKPLSGITVHYMVTCETHWTLFPLTIESHIDSSIAAPATAQTDANGFATFDGIRVKLKFYWLLPKKQRIESEMLFVNLDPLPDSPIASLYVDNKYQYLWTSIPFFEYLISPDKRHRGYFLGLSNELAMSTTPAGHEREEKNITTVRWEPRDIKKRNFVIRLKRT